MYSRQPCASDSRRKSSRDRPSGATKSGLLVTESQKTTGLSRSSSARNCVVFQWPLGSARCRLKQQHQSAKARSQPQRIRGGTARAAVPCAFGRMMDSVPRMNEPPVVGNGICTAARARCASSASDSIFCEDPSYAKLLSTPRRLQYSCRVPTCYIPYRTAGRLPAGDAGGPPCSGDLEKGLTLTHTYV